jgi:hypothetical protein
MNRREHSHLPHPKIRSVTFLSKREPPKSRSDRSTPEGLSCPAELCRPRFSFFFIQFSKNGHRRHDVMGHCRFWLWPGRVSLTRLSMIFAERWGEVFGRQRRTALVREAYIGGGTSGCQQGFGTFLNFLRRSLRTPLRRCVTPFLEGHLLPPGHIGAPIHS